MHQVISVKGSLCTSPNAAYAVVVVVAVVVEVLEAYDQSKHRDLRRRLAVSVTESADGQVVRG